MFCGLSGTSSIVLAKHLNPNLLVGQIRRIYLILLLQGLTLLLDNQM